MYIDFAKMEAAGYEITFQQEGLHINSKRPDQEFFLKIMKSLTARDWSPAEAEWFAERFCSQVQAREIWQMIEDTQ